MPALPAVRTATPPAIKLAFKTFPFVKPPRSESKELLATSKSLSRSLFFLKGLTLSRASLLQLTRRLRDGANELGLGHSRRCIDTDAGCELDKLRLAVRLQATIRRIPELARGLLGRCR